MYVFGVLKLLYRSLHNGILIWFWLTYFYHNLVLPGRHIFIIFQHIIFFFNWPAASDSTRATAQPLIMLNDCLPGPAAGVSPGGHACAAGEASQNGWLSNHILGIGASTHSQRHGS